MGSMSDLFKVIIIHKNFPPQQGCVWDGEFSIPGAYLSQVICSRRKTRRICISVSDRHKSDPGVSKMFLYASITYIFVTFSTTFFCQFCIHPFRHCLCAQKFVVVVVVCTVCIHSITFWCQHNGKTIMHVKPFDLLSSFLILHASATLNLCLSACVFGQIKKCCNSINFVRWRVSDQVKPHKSSKEFIGTF